MTRAYSGTTPIHSSASKVRSKSSKITPIKSFKIEAINAVGERTSGYDPDLRMGSVSNKYHGFQDLIQKGRQARAEDARNIYESKKAMQEAARAKAIKERLAVDNAARTLAQQSRLSIDENKAKLLQDMESNMKAILEDKFTAEIRGKVFQKEEQIASTYKQQIRDQTRARLLEDLEPVVKAELSARLELEVKQELRAELELEVKEELRAELASCVKEQSMVDLNTVARSELRSELYDEVYNELKCELIATVRNELEGTIRLEETTSRHLGCKHRNTSNAINTTTNEDWKHSEEDEGNEVFETAPEQLDEANPPNIDFIDHGPLAEQPDHASSPPQPSNLEPSVSDDGRKGPDAHSPADEDSKTQQKSDRTEEEDPPFNKGDVDGHYEESSEEEEPFNEVKPQKVLDFVADDDAESDSEGIEKEEEGSGEDASDKIIDSIKPCEENETLYRSDVDHSRIIMRHIDEEQGRGYNAKQENEEDGFDTNCLDYGEEVEGIHNNNLAYAHFLGHPTSFTRDSQINGVSHVFAQGFKRSSSTECDEDEEINSQYSKRVRRDTYASPEDDQEGDYSDNDNSEHYSQSQEEYTDEYTEEYSEEDDYSSEGQDGQGGYAVQTIIKETNTQDTAFTIDDSDDEDKTLVDNAGFAPINKLQIFEEEELFFPS